jgi:hypothetical protein
MNDSRFIQWKTSNPDGYDELLKRRRQKYAEDEAARQRQLAHNAAWREKQKQRKSRKRVPSPRFFMLEGRDVECWTVSRAAEFLGVSKQTITNLESDGTIPLNHHICESGRRWWPAAFVRWLKPYFEARFVPDAPGISAQEFHRRVWTGWAEAHVGGAIPVIATLNSPEATVDEDDDGQECSENT